MSQMRAEERQAAEEIRKMYNEDMEEEEEEMTGTRGRDETVE